MTDSEKWKNVAQAAQWLAEGREVEYRTCDNVAWWPYNGAWKDLNASNEYRLKPEPPKPREWALGWSAGARAWQIMSAPKARPDDGNQVILVREVIE